MAEAFASIGATPVGPGTLRATLLVFGLIELILFVFDFYLLISE